MVSRDWDGHCSWILGVSTLGGLLNIDINMENPYLWLMKTTVNIRDDLFRHAKARAALQGKTFGAFLEEALVRAIAERESGMTNWAKWAESLPRVSKRAGMELQLMLEEPDFRPVDKEMWK